MPGEIRFDLSAEEYHAHAAVGSTTLKTIHAKTPAHARAQLDGPKEPTPAMRFGTALHTVLLEPDSVGRRIAVLPEGIDRRTKAGKADWDAFHAENAERQVVTADDWAKLKAIQASVRGNPLALALLRHGYAEPSIFWDDGDTGTACKCRPDWLNEAARVVVDLKSTQDAEPRAFERHAYALGYHLQAAYYLDGVRELAFEPEAFVFVAVEKEPPYAVAFYQASASFLEAGRIAYRMALATFAECEAKGEWPGYPAALQELLLPPWAA